MNIPIKEFKQRRKIALNAEYREISGRLLALLEWMESIPAFREQLNNLRTFGGAEMLQKAYEYNKGAIEREKDTSKYPFINLRTPDARSIEEIASVGLGLLEISKERGLSLTSSAREFGILGNSPVTGPIGKFVEPFLDFIEMKLPEVPRQINKPGHAFAPPAVIHDSLKRFHAAHRNASKTCFIMMRFGKTSAHTKIEKAIKAALKKHGLTGLLARDREFHDDLYANIQTYMHGCEFGIAVFERVETNEFNPNVALEVGYMMGLRKQVLLLKDRTLTALHTDLVGKIYREFDPLDTAKTIPGQIDSWLSDKGLA